MQFLLSERTENTRVSFTYRRSFYMVHRLEHTIITTYIRIKRPSVLRISWRLIYRILLGVPLLRILLLRILLRILLLPWLLVIGSELLSRLLIVSLLRPPTSISSRPRIAVGHSIGKNGYEKVLNVSTLPLLTATFLHSRSTYPIVQSKLKRVS